MSIERKRQSGITMIGFLIVLAVGGFFAYLGMRLFPAYSEYYNVASAMEQLAKEPGSARMSPAQILDSLEKRMYVSYVDQKNVNKRSFQIKRSGTGYTLSVKYERRSPLIYNIDYVAMFDKTVMLGVGGDSN